MVEEWRPVEGYEGLYEVSNLGRVKSLARKVRPCRPICIRERILKPVLLKTGYFKVVLRKGKTAKQITIHRLVAQAFIPNPENLPCINHKDEIKTNNKMENLEWCDYRYNGNYGTLPARISTALKEYFKDPAARAKVCTAAMKCVVQLTMKGSFVAQYSCAKDAYKKTGISASNISRVCKLKRNSAGGYCWRFV